MPRATVTERQRWKNRIYRSAERAIEKFWEQRPDLRKQIELDAKSNVVSRLGIGVEIEKLERLTREWERISEERDALATALASTLSIPAYPRYSNNIAVEIDGLAEKEFHKLVEKHSTASSVIRIGEVRDELIDSVWLATSTKQIKELWEQFSGALSELMTPVQKEAVKMEPAEES